MDYAVPAGFIALPFAGGLVGGMVTKNGMGWYKKMNKAPLNPPDWVFGPVWSTLYTGMGYASYLIYKEGAGDCDAIKVPMSLYAGQLALNFAWTPLFFGVHKTGWALLDLLGMLGAIGGCIYTFHPLNPTAARLMMPYFVWVSFAGYLNYYIWKNNPSGATITEIKDE